jgi:hypothetical protein
MEFQRGQRVQFTYGSDEVRDVVIEEIVQGDIVGKDRIRENRYRRFKTNEIQNARVVEIPQFSA